MNLTVLIPFYNEENTLKESTLRVVNDLPEAEIILIDDCSTDNSFTIAEDLIRNYSNIKLIQNSSNLGKGGALKLAKSLINTSHVVIHDADLEYFPSDINEMMSFAITKPDYLVLGSRFIGEKSRKNIYKRTYIANKIMSQFFSLIFFKKITDIATCYKLMPSKFFIETNLKENGFSIEIEIVAKFLKHSKSLIEVPIMYDGRSYDEGKKIKFSDGIFYIINTLKYRYF